MKCHKKALLVLALVGALLIGSVSVFAASGTPDYEAPQAWVDRGWTCTERYNIFGSDEGYAALLALRETTGSLWWKKTVVTGQAAAHNKSTANDDRVVYGWVYYQWKDGKTTKTGREWHTSISGPANQVASPVWQCKISLEKKFDNVKVESTGKLRDANLTRSYTGYATDVPN